MNIRATALEEFWGTDFEDSVYLWEGAKHSLTLSEMAKITEATMADLFATPEDIAIAGDYCRQVYFKILPKLASKLNEISGVSLPATFWRTTFGYWLFRHICIVYEKYSYLSKIDIDKTSIKLLDKDSFYIPNDHYDYVYCFCNDFGVQQLVSHYYYLFKNREYPCISMNYNLTAGQVNHAAASDNSSRRRGVLDYGKAIIRKALNSPKSIRRKIATEFEPKIALCGVYFTVNVASTLLSGSKGMIGSIKLPSVRTDGSVNMERRKLLSIESENDFEYFLVQTLKYCLPKMFLEQFRDYYDVYLKDIKSKKFTHIVSENWISHIPSSIYVAIARNLGRKLICCEHGSGNVFDKTCLYWIDFLVADKYMTVGWEIKDKKVIPGGFMCRDIKPYQFQFEKKSILYIARTNFPYLMEFDIYNAPNTKLIKALKRIWDLYDLLPESLSDSFVLRPRRADNFWDTEHTLEVEKKNIRVDTGNFSDSISNARIVIIDHLSTGVAEILLMKIPCLIIQDDQHIPPLLEEISEIFDELKRCGVMHNSARSAVAHLADIYEDVQQWWNDEAVQTAVNKLISKTLAPPSKGIGYLISCLEQNNTGALD